MQKLVAYCAVCVRPKETVGNFRERGRRPWGAFIKRSVVKAGQIEVGTLFT